MTVPPLLPFLAVSGHTGFGPICAKSRPSSRNGWMVIPPDAGNANLTGVETHLAALATAGYPFVVISIRASRPFNKADGDGGQPGMWRSTGRTASTPPQQA